MKLTSSQQSYLAAAARVNLPLKSIKAGSSLKCVRTLVRSGLLRRDTHSGLYVITDAGRAALEKP